MLPHHRRQVAAGWWGWGIIVVLCILVPTACHVQDVARVINAAAGVIGQAHAGARFIAEGTDAMIVLHDDPCAFTEQVVNLPLRATWQEKDARPIEGCWALNGAGVVMLYFEDRTVAGLPKTAFSRLGKT
jgi:hypothetical protein